MVHKTRSRLQQLISILKSGVIVVAGGYLFGLAFYLILRTVVAGECWWVALINDFAPVIFIPLPFVLLVTCLLQTRCLVILALVHSLVAGLWFGPRFLPKQSVAASELTLNVVTLPIGASRLPQLESHYILQTALSYNSSARDAEIMRLLARLGAEPYPYVVAGDFNMNEYATTYSKIADIMGDAYRERSGGWGGTWPISIVDELPRFVPPLLRVDYIWRSEHFRTVEVRRGPRLGSDHLPLYAELELCN